MKNSKLLRLSSIAILTMPILVNTYELSKGAFATAPANGGDCYVCNMVVTYHRVIKNTICDACNIGCQRINQVECVSAGAPNECNATVSNPQECPTEVP